MKKIYNVVIADDHDFVLQGIKNYINSISNFQVVGQARNGKEAQDIINSENVDILITDIDMPVLSGTELIQIMNETHPELKIMAVTMHIASWILKKLHAAGVNVIVSKNASCNELDIALHALISEKAYMSEDIKESIIDNALNNKKSNINEFKIKLTDRELEVLKLIAEEYSTTEISQKLFISINTVETHRKNLILKFGVKNSVGLVKEAMERNLL